MTAKPPNTSTLTSDTQSETTDRVSFDSITDSKGTLVPKNSVTYDPMLELKGKADAGRILNIRDRFSYITDVTTLPSGNWIKQLDFSNQEFKRFSLNVIEKDPPQDSSPPYDFIWATETPIIKVVTGKDGPINDGDDYTGDSLEFTGNAPPGMEVEAFNGDTSTGKKIPVNSVGLFKLTLDGLTAGTYKIKIKAANGKESDVFTFHVVSDIELILDRVYDSRGKIITEGDTTYSDTATVHGYAWIGKEVQLLNFDEPVDGAIGTAQEPDGLWTIEFELSAPNLYSLTAKALYGEGETSKPPYLFEALEDVKLSLDNVVDSKGSIDEGKTTYDKKVKVSGYARPGKRVQLRNHGVPIVGATTPTNEKTGCWEIELDVIPLTYSLTVEGLYDDNEITDPPRTFTVKLDVELSLDDVLESEDGPSVPDDEITYKNLLFIVGHARPGESIQLFNDRDPIEGAIATADPVSGAWTFPLNVTAGYYKLTAQAKYGDNETTNPPRTFTVKLDVALSLDDVLESEDGPSVPDDEITYKNLLFIVGHARPGESIQLFNDRDPIEGAIATADPVNGAWTFPLNVTAGYYKLTAQAKYGDNETTNPPRTFTVESIIKPHNTRVFDSDGPIEDNGTTPYNYVIVRGDAAPLAAIKLQINGVTDLTPEPTDDTGKWAKLVQDLDYGTKYTFIAEADYGDNAESNPWTINPEAATIVPILGEVTDPEGNKVGGSEGGTTLHTKLTFAGQAKPHETVEILNGDASLGEATVDEKGNFRKVILGLPETAYNIKIRGLYTGNPESTQHWTFTIEQAVRPTIRRIFDSTNDIDPDGYTYETTVTVEGQAHRLQKVQIFDGDDFLREVPVEGNNTFKAELGGLRFKNYDLRIKPLYGSGLPHSAVHRFSIITRGELSIDNVTDPNGIPIPEGGSVSQNKVFTFNGRGAPPNTYVSLYRDNDIWAGRRLAEDDGTFHVNTGSHPVGGPYKFYLKGVDGRTSQSWYIGISH
ncbi:hypothetical protein CD175_18035 [Pseudomonas laurylsulfatiphila]|uniref:Ig-like domain repeat protein n=1 Tax=Pseudomonas laurylsulfatiphila TaxID=2011015 RepID=A0A2S6FL30_9PSED|nr:carboxypeptidase regulatory-like domain-containing protein [Pseudomonas laurylsulfatiphila]PPK38137.1 hypothetical protein CD175_18035 [Pseudomonas laurylsulfatiphila]